MSNRIEIHRPTEADKPSVELMKKRDAKLIKKALGKSASDSLKAKAVRESLASQNINTGVELEKQQLEVVQESLGLIATEKGITKLPQRFRSRRLAKKIKHASRELA